MFFDIGGLQFLVLLVLGILLFGPDKLPKLIQDAASFLRKVRDYSDNAKRDIRSELGPEFKDFEFEDLNPKRFAKKHLMDGDDLGLRQLRDDLDVRKELTEVSDSLNGRSPRRNSSARAEVNGDRPGRQRPLLEKAGDREPTVDLGKGGDTGGAGAAAEGEESARVTRSAESPPFDVDAT